MEQPAYFLSDAHLGAFPSGCVAQREELLVHQLESWVGKASHVFVLGDLFEFWMEYRHYVGKRHFRVLRALSLLVDNGCQVHLFQGNHDFAYGCYFTEELGVQVHRELVTELQGHRLFLCHGDGLARSDRAYRVARRIVDFAPNRFLFRLIHPDWGMELARLVGSTSREANKDRERPLAEYLAGAAQKMREHGCDLFVHGHHHQGGSWNIAEGQVVNSGQWLFRLGYARLLQGKCEFVEVIP